MTTEGFGGKASEPATYGFEQRASWSPTSGRGDDPAALDVAAHVTAWCDALAAAAGLPPLAPGTHTLPPARPTEPRPRRRQ